MKELVLLPVRVSLYVIFSFCLLYAHACKGAEEKNYKKEKNCLSEVSNF